MILTQDEIAALTRRDRPTAQARVLRLLRVAFRTHPTDGVLLVSRAAVEQALGVAVERAIEEEFEVNVAGVLGHGTPTVAH
ncbi:MAG TPA: DUF4224 domain-containing protein [Casimicrobiaceae bacterium]|nr:DUF4224 domain-containing protein [Casimicrobiaceae bacterium]